MKILAMSRQPSITKVIDGTSTVTKWMYFAIFDTLPETTYERIGEDYVGSALDAEGNIILSHFLVRRPYGDAFAGREVMLNMKDGTTETVKDYWFDSGAYPPHGAFTAIGGRSLEGISDTFLFHGYNINRDIFNRMMDAYLAHDDFREPKDIREAVKRGILGVGDE